MAKHGGPCGANALRGHRHCLVHAAAGVQRERRAMRLARPMTAAQRDRARQREAARAQREVWRSDRWAPGGTVTLGPRDDRFQEDARASGFDLALFSPATLDAARWAWLHVQLGRVTPEQFRVRVAWHAGRD